MKMMQGPLPLRKSLIRVLKSELPKTIDMYNSQYGTSIPYPGEYQEYEAVQMAHGSKILISVTVSNTRDLTTVDMDDWAAMQYLPKYSVVVYAWCFTELDEKGEVPVDARVKTLEMRDNLAVILRATILNNPALDDAERYSIIESTLDEEFSDSSPVPNASGRHIAGVQHSFTVEVEEQLDRTGTSFLDAPVIVDPHFFPQDDPGEIQEWPDTDGFGEGKPANPKP